MLIQNLHLKRNFENDLKILAKLHENRILIKIHNRKIAYIGYSSVHIDSSLLLGSLNYVSRVPRCISYENSCLVFAQKHSTY